MSKTFDMEYRKSLPKKWRNTITFSADWEIIQFLKDKRDAGEGVSYVIREALHDYMERDRILHTGDGKPRISPEVADTMIRAGKLFKCAIDAKLDELINEEYDDFGGFLE